MIAAELFVNSTWTSDKKVPAKSPFGVDLHYCPDVHNPDPSSSYNAFEKLEDAISYADTMGYVDVRYIDYDKTVAVSDVDGNVTYISAKEIKGTETIKTTKTGTTYTAQSKQTVANKITFDNAGASGATVAGFKTVELNGGAAEFTVSGGANTVTHVHTSNTNGTFKDSATVGGKADGTLTVSGAKVAVAGGAWAEVLSENGAEITSGAPAFTHATPGDPESIYWSTDSLSVLAELPGYATVMLTGSAYAENITGGSFSFTHVTDRVCDAKGTTTSLNKTFSIDQKASGKLTVEDSTISRAHFYATVKVGGESDFDYISGGNATGGDKTTCKYTNTAKSTTIKTTSSYTEGGSAAGSLVVDGIGYSGSPRNADGFAKVTVKNARLGALDASTRKYTTSETVEKVMGSSLKVTSASGSSYTYGAGGTLTTDKTTISAMFGNIRGYSKIDLANATVNGDIYAAGGYQGGTGASSGSTVKTEIDTLLTEYKYSGKENRSAAGTVTLSKSKVYGLIAGAATVKLTDTEFSANSIVGGKYGQDHSVVSGYAYDLDNGITTMTSSRTDKGSGTVLGKLTMLNGTLGGNCHIGDMATVELNNVGGSLNYGYAENYTANSSAKETWVSSGYTTSARLRDNKLESSITATGAFTAVAASDGLAIGSLMGYAKVGLIGVTVSDGAGIFAQPYKTTSNVYFSRNLKTGAVTSSFSSSLSRQLVGSVGLSNTSMTNGGIRGYLAVTLDKSYVNGNIGSDFAHRDTDMKNFKIDFRDDGGDLVLVNQTFTYSSSYAPNTALTLKNGAMVTGAAYGLKSLTLGDGDAVQGKADMLNGNNKITRNITRNAKTGIYTQDYQYTSKHDAKGTVTATYGTVGGNISGAGKVTATGAKLGGIYADTFSYNFKATATGNVISYNYYDSIYILDDTKAVTNNSNWTSSCTAGATVTLSDTTVAGGIAGYQTVKVTGGSIAYAYGFNKKSTEIHSSSTSVYLSSSNQSRWAAGNFTATNANISSGGIDGYQTVVVTGGAILGDITGGKLSSDGMMSSSLNAKGARTVSMTDSCKRELLGKVALTGAATIMPYYIGDMLFGDDTIIGIDGYADVTLDDVEVLGGINSSYDLTSSGANLKLEYSDGGITLAKQTYSSGFALDPKTAVTLRNGAEIYAASAVKTLNVSSGCKVWSDANLFARKSAETDNITSKNGVYEEKHQIAGSRTAAGTVNVTGGTAASIEGAAKVTVKDAVIDGGIVTSKYVSSKGIAARGATVVDVGDGRYKVDTATATMYASAGSNCTSATGAATLTGTTVEGGISGFATVKLSDVNVRRVLGRNYNDSWSYIYESGSLEYKRSSNSFTTGTLNAADVTFTGSDSTVIAGFATVNLTDCFFNHSGLIYGGSYGLVASGSGVGANWQTASAALSSSSVKSFAAAGALTAKNSVLGGIQNMATVNLTDCMTGNIVVDSGSTATTTLTLAGNNDIGSVGTYSIQRINTINAKSGFTTVGSGFLGTDGNDTITVAAKAELDIEGVVIFGDGVDALTVNGIFRAGGWVNAGELEKLSGSGLLALNDVSAKYVLDEIKEGNIKFSGKLEIVAGGNGVRDVLAVRTRKEELADDTAEGARRFDGIGMAGWLCGIEDDEGRFRDTEDWITFTNFDGCTYEVELTDAARKSQIKVEVYKNGDWVQDVAWNGERFAIDNTAFEAGVDYQLRLTTESVTNGFSYFFGVPALG